MMIVFLQLVEGEILYMWEVLKLSFFETYPHPYAKEWLKKSHKIMHKLS